MTVSGDGDGLAIGGNHFAQKQHGALQLLPQSPVLFL
jgi:hypothetical protein